ncbi:MAG: hypothetical protein GTO40_24365 [Deltaproteobacteria bacterium]|nr:hypothetical protein [Deltaproteobacteria bacterium]
MRIIALVLLVCALIGTWFGYIADRPIIDLGGTVFKVSFLGFILILIATDVFEQEIVTVDTISGAICIYLLIGLMWAELYSLIEFIQPGSFTIQKFLPDAPGYNPQHQNPLFLYYSFVTLTTLGYGDITPLSPPARAFSFLEAVVGQIFVAVMIARLVGLHIAHSSKKDSA